MIRPNNQQSLIDYYARRAAEYEQIYHKPERQAELALLRARLSGAFTGMRVREIACGTGYWTPCIAQTAAEVLATDINEEVLQIARNKAFSQSHVRFEQGDMYDPAPPGSPFNALFGGFIWSHIPLGELDTWLHQLCGSLLPGSKVMFLDNQYVAGSSTPIAHTDDAGNTYQDRRLADGSLHRVLKNFPTDDFLYAQLQSLTCDIEIYRYTYYWTLTCRTRTK